MSDLIEEVRIWNTPIIGAYLLWKFTVGYMENHPNGDSPIGLHHFIAMGILSSKKMMENISDSRPNLQSYVRGFEEKHDSDLLLSVHQKIKDKKHYTLKSIDIAVSNGLLFWEPETAKLHAASTIKKPSRGKNLKSDNTKHGKKAEILGKWFSEHDLNTIAKYLKVTL